jgi:hypothetical protein
MVTLTIDQRRRAQVRLVSHHRGDQGAATLCGALPDASVRCGGRRVRRQRHAGPRRACAAHPPASQAIAHCAISTSSLVSFPRASCRTLRAHSGWWAYRFVPTRSGGGGTQGAWAVGGGCSRHAATMGGSLSSRSHVLRRAVRTTPLTVWPLFGLWMIEALIY